MMTEKTKPDNYATRIDEQGNRIISIRRGDIISLYLKLKEEKRKRKVGFINVNTKTLHVRRSDIKHRFRKLNAYGLNYQLISDAKRFEKIRLVDENNEWLIDRSWILNTENINFLHFKGQGFERQVFLPLENIEQFKREKRW